MKKLSVELFEIAARVAESGKKQKGLFVGTIDGSFKPVSGGGKKTTKKKTAKKVAPKATTKKVAKKKTTRKTTNRKK